MNDRIAAIGPLSVDKARESNTKIGTTEPNKLSTTQSGLAVLLTAAQASRGSEKMTGSAASALHLATSEGIKSSLLAQRVFLGAAIGRKQSRKERLRKAFEIGFSRFSEDDENLHFDFPEHSSRGVSKHRKSDLPLALLAKKLMAEFDVALRRKYRSSSTVDVDTASSSLARWLRKNVTPLIRLLDIIDNTSHTFQSSQLDTSSILIRNFINELTQTVLVVSAHTMSQEADLTNMRRFYGKLIESKPMPSSQLDLRLAITIECKSWPNFLARYSYIRSQSILISDASA
jgi:hypothetical protein